MSEESLEGINLPLKLCQYDKQKYDDSYMNLRTSIVEGIGDPIFSVIYKYSALKTEPRVEKLAYRQRIDSSLILLLDHYKKDSYNFVYRSKEFADSRSLRNDTVSKIVTAHYKIFQESDEPESLKVVARLLAAPLSIIHRQNKEQIIEFLVVAASMMPYLTETSVLSNMRSIISNTDANIMIVSHMGKSFAEKILWKDDNTEPGIWLDIDLIQDKFADPLDCRQEIKKIFYPTKEDFIEDLYQKTGFRSNNRLIHRT